MLTKYEEEIRRWFYEKIQPIRRYPHEGTSAGYFVCHTTSGKAPAYVDAKSRRKIKSSRGCNPNVLTKSDGCCGLKIWTNPMEAAVKT